MHNIEIQRNKSGGKKEPVETNEALTDQARRAETLFNVISDKQVLESER